MRNSQNDRPAPVWPNAVRAAALFAVDMPGTAGVNLRARPGPVREGWLEILHGLLPRSCPLRRFPHHISDEGLLGGLDLTATLRNGRPIFESGLLARADGGAVVLTGAERATAALAARIGRALDARAVRMQRDDSCDPSAARIGLVMLDEGIDDERPPPALLDRVAFHLDLDAVRLGEIASCGFNAETIAAARDRLSGVHTDADILRALCEAAAALGIASIRAPLLAVRAARAAAALAGRTNVGREDAVLAGSLVLSPRATVIPPTESPPHETETPDVPDRAPRQDREQEAQSVSNDRPVVDLVVEAARAAIPADLLAHLQSPDGRVGRIGAAGHSGALISSRRGGRPAGVRRGEPRDGARLNVVETLRAAAPWQALRRGAFSQSRTTGLPPQRIEIRRDDFRIIRREQRTETTSIFAVDASGSSALHRLAEAKGAVEQLLADCYIRRDHVALIAFRGQRADLVLPPTRSLARARRSLGGLPGGGGTPLATALDTAVALAVASRRKGQSPVIVLLTDGQANIARDGMHGRDKAAVDALDAARIARLANIAALVVDISPHPHMLAERLATEMAARYLPLPYADAKTLSRAVQTVSARTT